jgi:hypothetical protein
MTETKTDKFSLPKFTKRSVANLGVKVIASTSVKLIVGTAIAQMVPTETKADKAKVIVGTYVLSGIVTDAAKSWAVDELDSKIKLVALVKNLVQQEIEKSKNQSETPDK